MSPIESSFEYLDLSWEMFGELCRALALKVARDYDPDVVVGIARAGAVPGAVVATILGVDFYSMIISWRTTRVSRTHGTGTRWTSRPWWAPCRGGR